VEYVHGFGCLQRSEYMVGWEARMAQRTRRCLTGVNKRYRLSLHSSVQVFTANGLPRGQRIEVSVQGQTAGKHVCSLFDLELS